MSIEDHETGFSLRVLRVGGRDAEAFLQSQLTSDVKAAGDALQPTGWCNPKGRVEAVMLIRARDGEFDLLLPDPIADDVLKRMNLFRIGRDVVLETAGAADPDGPGAAALSLDRRRSLGVSGHARQLSAEWLRADIDCRMPWILDATRGRFLPQMLGLESLGGLSYRKGCFPGQEVIARVHYRGRVTQRTARFTARARAPEPGTELGVGPDSATVLYAVSEPDDPEGCRGLAVVPAEVEPGTELTWAGGAATLVD